MNDIAISVIIPAFNSAATIARALESVFAQTYTDFEVIVVDDGSVDELVDALHPYAERIKLIRQTNAGASAARNTGARHARGKFLAFLDADDFWHSRKLELQAVAFKERPDICYCWTQTRRWSPGMPDPTRDAVDPGKGAARYMSNFAKVFADPYLGTPGVMIYRDAFNKLGGFREDLASAEDIDLWLRAAYGRVIGHILAPLFFVVTVPTSLTARLSEGTYRDNIRVIDEFCAAHPEFAAQHRSLVARVRGGVYENWGSSALVKGRLGDARSLLWHALRSRTTFRTVHLLGKVMLRGGMFATRG